MASAKTLFAQWAGRAHREKSNMKKNDRIRTTIFLSLIALVAMAIPAAGRSHRTPQFVYVGGTEALPEGCDGKLELLQTAMVFECTRGSVTAPYTSITLMQYSSKVNRKVRKMKLQWAVKPTTESSNHNLFFTVLFSGESGTQAIILRVLPATMRPYLAEIELRTGHWVDVDRLD
jgi:hypothetical protein